mgnify:CR=1 FL=1
MIHEFVVLVVGEINPDVVVAGSNSPVRFGQAEVLVDDVSLHVGSSSVITAAGLVRLGLRVAFVGVVGPDTFGSFMLASMQSLGIDTIGCRVEPSARTGAGVVLTRPGGDRAILTHTGSMATLTADAVPSDLLRRARHLHVGSYYLQPALQPGLADLFQFAHAVHVSTSLDCNFDPSERWSGSIETLLPLIDLFMPNAAEASGLTGQSDPPQALARLVALSEPGRLATRPDPILAVKLGSDGAIARRGLESVRVAALDVQPVDTIGAGDAFDAGLIRGFVDDLPLAQMVALAVTCGTMSTRSAGGTGGQPNLSEALATMASGAI